MCVCVCFNHAFSRVSDERCTRPPKAEPGLTWPPGDPDLTGEKLDKDLANRGQPDGHLDQILYPGGTGIPENHQLANISVMKPICFGPLANGVPLKV